MFVTNWISTTKIQKISEITNFFRHYFLSRTEVEPNLQGSEESRGSHHLFSFMNHYGLVWFADFSYLCRRLAAPQHNIQASLMILLSVCIIFAED